MQWVVWLFHTQRWCYIPVLQKKWCRQVVLRTSSTGDLFLGLSPPCSPPTVLENKPFILVRGRGYNTRKYIFPEHRVPMRRMVISHQQANLWRLTFFFSPLCPSCFASPSEHIVPSPGKGGTFALFANTELQPGGFIRPRETKTIYIQRGWSIPSRGPPVPVPCSHEQLLHLSKSVGMQTEN